MILRPALIPWFVSTWILLAIIGIRIFTLKNVGKKKQFVSGYYIGTALVFAVFVLLITGDWGLMGILIPALTLISLANIKLTKICDSCATVRFNRFFFQKLEYCSRCGKKY